MAAYEIFDVLRDIQAGVFRNSAPLPLKLESHSEWQGLGFQLGGIRLVAPLGEVTEILQVPRMTHLPGTCEWVIGVANIRGRLLPLIDTHRYLGLTATVSRNQWRVLVIEAEEMVVGLVVEQSHGMQYFVEDNFEPTAPSDVESITPYVSGAYRHGGRVFYVASLKSLIRDERFFEVAADEASQTNWVRK